LQDPARGEITQLLSRWEQGEPEALESLAPLVYDQLRAIAECFLRNERPDHTLQPTAVVNEVFLICCACGGWPSTIAPTFSLSQRSLPAAC
jgi:hypothetical protein